MLTFAKVLPRTAITRTQSSRRPAWLWPVLVAVLMGFIGLSAQAEPVAISPEGARATAVDIAYDAEGTAWLPSYFRALGATIGRDVCLYPTGADPMMTEPDLVSIGDGACINAAFVRRCRGCLLHLHTGAAVSGGRHRT